jgi:drug/metabolite transporter (DMT)-like permease
VNQKPTHNQARLLLLATAILFSTGGAAVKACDVGPYQIACLRSLIAAVTILVLVPESRRGWNRRVFLVACAYASTLTLYICANKLTTAANVIFLQSTAPIYVLLLSPFLLKEQIQRRDIVVLALLGGGMTLFFVGDQAPTDISPNPDFGNLLATVAGLTWALTVMGLRWLAKSGSGNAAAAAGLGSIIAAVVVLPMAVPFTAGSASDWLIVLYLGVFQVGLAYFLFARAMPRLSAMEASLLLMIEPALNPIWAWMVHSEVPNGLAMIGGGVILVALLLRAFLTSGTPARDSQRSAHSD